MRTATLTLLFLLSFICSSFAAWDKPAVRLTGMYRYDLRQDNHDLWITRASLALTYKNIADDPLFKIIPFFEARRNIHKHIWERKEAGVEIGKDIFPWFYLGSAIEQVWMNEDYQYYRRYEKRQYTACEPRLLFSHNILNTKFLTLKGFILDEYTYDFNKARGTCNEVAIGVIIPVTKYLESQVNWRHIDRIHYYDSDTVEGSVTLVF